MKSSIYISIVKKFPVLLIVLFVLCFTKTYATDFAITFNVSHYQNGNNISCNGAHDGMVEAVIVGGTAPYVYSWNTGSFNRVLSGIGAGAYTFTVTDASSQTISATVELIEPVLLQLFLWPKFYGGYNISEQGGHDGIINAEVSGGSLPYIFAWSNGATKSQIEELTAGTYSLLLTDANGCTISGSKTLTEPTPLHVVSLTSPQYHGYNISCNSGKDGAINLSVTGGVPPYKYDWNTGSFDEDLSNLTAGEYSVRITDDNQAEIIASIVLTQPAGSLKVDLTPQVYANGFNLSCHDCSNGSLTAIGSVGVAPYTFLWSNGQTTTTISGLQAIDYNCIITDVNGCTSISGKTLYAPERDDWSMIGNANIDPTTQFMGTTDNKDFVVRTNNIERMRIKNTGVIEALGGLKVAANSSNSSSPVYVDNSGILRIGEPGDILLPPNCDALTFSWYRDKCGPSTINYDIYLKPVIRNVGIGTITPTTKLDVVGDIQSSSLAGSGFNLLQSSVTGKINKVSPSTNPSNEILFGNGTWGQLPSGINAWSYANGFIFNNPFAAKIGINTSTPRENLEVSGSILASFEEQSNNYIKMWHDNLHALISNYGTGSLLINYNNGKDIDICTGATNGVVSIGGNTFMALQSGQVGIGTNSIPAGFKFGVEGNSSLGWDVRVGHKLDVCGADIMVGKNDGRFQGVNLDNRALVHGFEDDLIINYQGDFEGGVVVNSTNLTSKAFRIIDNSTGVTNFQIMGDGTVYCREVNVQIDDFPDYVFDSEYPLLDLNELSSFILKNRHLPNLPSRSEVLNKGIMDIGDMQIKLLEKIEELTLYVIQINEQNAILKSQIEKLKE